MSCNSNCYDSPCSDYNPQYEDCGCLNPTTFECVTKPGTYTDIGITNDMNGMQVLAAINATMRYPYVKMTETQKNALSVGSGTIGLHVYQTDGTEGVYVYKSTGWTLAY